MITSLPNICIEELYELQVRSSAITRSISQMKKFLNDFSSSQIAQAILKRKELLKKELAKLRGEIACYRQNIKNRQAAIDDRLLVEQRKKKKREFENLMQDFSNMLTKANRKKVQMHEISRRCLEQILEVAKFSLDSMVLSLQAQNHGDQSLKQAAEERTEVVLAEMQNEQHLFRQARKVIEDRLKVQEAMLEETNREIIAWLAQDREHLAWTMENDPIHKHDAITLYRKKFPDDTLEDLVQQAPTLQQIQVHRSRLKTSPGIFTTMEDAPEKNNQPWKLFLVMSEEDEGIPLPNSAEEFVSKLRELLDKSCFQGIELSAVFDKLALEARRIDEQCPTSSRILGHKFNKWIKTKVGLDYRMLVLPDKNVRHLKFFLYPKKAHKQVLAQ